ncbi:hypothetical protein QVD17_03378 [Tagetes erecta]|uniref:Uncharacterized protein n=1 Tax=Tagetes erecta TaxID=13708 RepID=A0AAD8P9P9_TARER|nr:hypothetical protein QVD17_03378 [Tagetes erecta]
MPMLTSLTLASTRLCDRQLSKLVEYLPNLQVLNLEGVIGVQELKIHHFNLKTCHLVVNTVVHNCQESITLVTPNLIALKVVSALKATLHVEAPMLSRFHLSIPALCNACEFHVKGFEYLKTLWLECNHIGSSLSRFPITRTLENLTLSSRNKPPRVDARGSQATIRKVFTIFPNVSSLCIKSNTWLELEACLDPQGWEILDGRKGLRTIRGYLMLVDLSLTFSCVARVVDQCVGLSEVSLLINRDVIYHRDDSGHVPKSFMSKCMARWPELKWRWGIWGEHGKDYWITDPITGQELIKCVRACNEVLTKTDSDNGEQVQLTRPSVDDEILPLIDVIDLRNAIRDERS